MRGYRITAAFWYNSCMEEMFDKIAQKYDFWNDIISVFMQKMVKNIVINELKFFKGAGVLDLGIGTGDLGGLILKNYPECKVTGVDLSSKMLEIAKKKYPDISYFKQNAERLDFEDSKFDFVVSGFVLRNIQNKDAALSEIYRVLKDGGYFLQLDFGDKNFLSRLFACYVVFLSFFMKNGWAYRYLIKSKNTFLTPDELLELYSNHGFLPVVSKKLAFGVISYQIVQKPEKM